MGPWIAPLLYYLITKRAVYGQAAARVCRWPAKRLTICNVSSRYKQYQSDPNDNDVQKKATHIANRARDINHLFEQSSISEMDQIP